MNMRESFSGEAFKTFKGYPFKCLKNKRFKNGSNALIYTTTLFTPISAAKSMASSLLTIARLIGDVSVIGVADNWTFTFPSEEQ